MVVSYPEIIQVHQYRGAFRVAPPLAEPIGLKIGLSPVEKPDDYGSVAPGQGPEKNEEYQWVKAIVQDISITGMGLLTKNKNLAAGTEIDVNLEIPGMGCFKKKAVVVYLIPSGNSQFPFRCGIKFNMSKIEKDRIHQYLVKLQRQGLKRQKGL